MIFVVSVILCRSKSVPIFPSIQASQVIELHSSLRKDQQIQLFFQRHCIIFRSRQTYLLCDFVFKYFIGHHETPPFLTKNDIFLTIDHKNCNTLHPLYMYIGTTFFFSQNLRQKFCACNTRVCVIQWNSRYVSRIMEILQGLINVAFLTAGRMYHEFSQLIILAISVLILFLSITRSGF